MNEKNQEYWYSDNSCSLQEFNELVSQQTDRSGLEFTDAVEKNIPIYDCSRLRTMLSDVDKRKPLLAEWGRVFLSGAGVIVLKHAYKDTSVIDEATDIYNAIVDEERKRSGGGADHFAKAGANDRIWNSLEKLCLKNPDVFARYFSNEVIAAASEAWLGPNYQITAQINTVRPGGSSQQVHRDYHLGFQTNEAAQTYPAHVHLFSPMLTLQGAVAHVDIPVESGPTKLLPFSQSFKEGYLAYRKKEFAESFAQHAVQLPLEKGDLIFFSPALFHSAGSNRTENIARMVNLLQVSSAYGRAMESINRVKMCKQLYPAVLRAKQQNTLTDAEISCAIAACAEGYSFPTNLDSDPPVGGLAPQTQQALFHQGIGEGWDIDTFIQKLDEQQQRRES